MLEICLFTGGVVFILKKMDKKKVEIPVNRLHVHVFQRSFCPGHEVYVPYSEMFVLFAGTYFAVSMLLVSLSLILSVLVLNVHHRGDIVGRKVPVWARKFFLDKLSNCCQRGKKHEMSRFRCGAANSSEIPNGQIPLQQVCSE